MATVASSQEQFDGFPLKTESTRLKILFSPEGHNAPPLQKTFLVKDGQEAMLETLLRRAFGVPPHLTVSLVLDGDIICCPVHLIDLNEARRAKEIELQTFPSTQPIAPTFAPQPPVSTVPHVEFPDTYVPPVALQPSAPMATARPKSKPTSRSSSTNNVADLAASTPPVAADVTSSSTSVPAKKTAAPKRARKAPIEAPSSGSHLIAGDADVDSDPDAGGALDASREDRRKNNRGLDHRRSYLKEEKILVMWLKDCGRSADEIAQLTRVSKSNVEKWCSDKTRDKILAKYRNTSAGSGAGDVLTTSLDANGLHFLATDKFAMQSALLFLLDRLRTLSSESHMVVDEDALFAAADLTRHSQTSYGATAALSGGHGFYVAHMPVPAAQINYLPPLARELTDKVHASVVQQAFAHANKRARIGEVVQSQSQQLLQQAASLLGAFNRPSEGATAAVEDEEEDDDDEDDEESAREMLEQMLHQRRASLGLAGTAPSAAKKWSALDVLSAAAGPVDVDALPKTFGSSSIVSAKAPPATSYTASSSAPSTASMTSSAASATTLPLSSLPPLLPRYENVRMEYTDQFALSVASRPANEFGADAVPPEVGSNGATPRETTSADATIAPLSTAGVVQAQRQLLPSTKFLLHLRPQLLQQQDEEDAAVLTLLGE